MKCTFIFPPQWTPLNPHFALASLIAQLKKHNCDVSLRDLNIEYYDKVLTKDFIKNSLDNAVNSIPQLHKELAKEFSPNKSPEDYSDDFKKIMEKYSKIRDFTEKRSQEALNVIDTIDEAKSVLKSNYIYKQLLSRIK